MRGKLCPALLLAAGALGLGTTGCSDDGDGPSETKLLTLLFTSDEHSHMLAYRPELDDFPPGTSAGTGALVGGVARRATVLREERDRALGLGSGVLTLSAGDNVMGGLSAALFESEGIEYQIMSALGYDATTIGNHELDFGPSPLAHAITAAQAAGALPAIVAANIRFDDADAGDDSLAALYGSAIVPYRVLTTSNGLRVGVLGWLGANAASVATNKGPVLFSAPAESETDTALTLELMRQQIQPVIDQLRDGEGVDVVVGLSHSGQRVVATGVAEGEDPWLCGNLQGVDVIISGHSHNSFPEPIRTTQADGRSCLVLNGGGYGTSVGRIDLSVEVGGEASATFDPATQTMVSVDDTTSPDPELVTQTSEWINRIEAASDHGQPYLARLLSLAEGTTVTDDTATTGDLYFRPLTHTSFAVTDNMMLNYLSADSMLAMADQLGIDAVMALESAGVTRAGIEPGTTGVIGASDAYNVVPLGNSSVDGTLGYPLVHVYITPFELRAVFEFAAVLGPTDSDFLLGQAGARVTYDKTRPPAQSIGELIMPDHGWVMRIEIDTDHSDGTEQYDMVLYDREQNITNDNYRVSAVTSSYIAEFAGQVGVDLKNADDDSITVEEAYIHRADQSEVKQLEAFLGYLYAQPGGELDVRYDVNSANRTRRNLCDSGCD